MINSPNLIPFVIAPTADAIEVEYPRVRIADGTPFDPRTIPDGSDSGVRGVGSGEGGNFESVSNVELVILKKVKFHRL